MADGIELEARLSALEMIVTTLLLQTGIGSPGFEPTAFAQSRRDAWLAVGRAVCDSCGSQDDDARFAKAYADALERLGHLLVTLAEPVQEAVDEASPRGNSIDDASRESVAEMERRSASGAPTAGAGDIG